MTLFRFSRGGANARRSSKRRNHPRTKSIHPCFEKFEPRQLLSADSVVVFNELMYNPAGTDETFEFVELHNQMSVDVDLSGWKLDEGVEFTFPEGTIIAGGGYLVIAKDPAALELAAGVTGALGPYDGQLSNGGEIIELLDRNDRLMDLIEYDDAGAWPASADGSGASLAKIDPASPSDLAKYWASSRVVGGTPGEPNSLESTYSLTTLNLAFNEIEAAGAAVFWLELINLSENSIDVGGFVLASSSGAEYVLPTQSVAAGDYLVLSETQIGFAPAEGEGLYLYNSDGSLVVDAAIVENALGGRHQETGEWLRPNAPTPGYQNTFALHDEIVINEIMYHDNPQIETPSEIEKTVLVEMGANWSYESSGADLGTAWKDPAYDDSSWLSGPASFGAGTADYGSVILADGPRAYWNFDESSTGTGTAYDQVGSRDGTFTGSAQRTTGLVGVGAAEFFGASSDAVQISSGGGVFYYTTGVSVEAIIRPNASLGSHQYEEIFRKEDGDNRILLSFQEYGSILSFGLNVGGYGELDMPLDGVAGRPTLADLKDGDAHHIVATYDSTTGKKAIWVDGVERYSVTLSGTITSGGSAPAYIGSYSGTDEPFQGVIDEVALYDYALSAGQIGEHNAAQIMNAATTLPLGPTTYYFRSEFEFDGDPSATQLTLDALIDDGAVFYLNGVEVYRQNMPEGSITYDTFAALEVELPGASGPLVIPSGALVAGTNVLAVEVHQAVAADADVFFTAKLEAVETISQGKPYAESSEEWIELYNRSAVAVDLSGWAFEDAIDFEFPSGTTIGPSEYLVVAADAAALQAKYPSIDVIGNFSRNLSNQNDRILLVDAIGNPADEVHYYEDDPWPSHADGGGSSLELRDPNADNSKAEAWSASIEGDDSEWQTVTYRGIAVNPPGSNNPATYNEFILGLLDSGEILIDDVSVIEDPDGDAVQLIQNGSFELGTTDTWRIIGNHHGVVVDDPDDANNQVLHLTANGVCEHLANHAETTLKDGSSFVSIQLGTEYEISMKVKWLAGSSQLHTRLFFNLLPRTTVLEVPELNGTPGSQNSVFEVNLGPTYGELQHGPMTPAVAEAITVSVVAEDSDGVAAMLLWYSVNGGGWSSAAMTPGDNGLYMAAIPGQSAGAIVQFYVEGEDQLGATSTYPAAGPDSRALIKVDDGMSSVDGLHDMRIIMTAADAALLGLSTNLMSNDRLGATVVDDGKVYYDVGVRLKGSEHGRADLNRRGFSVAFHSDNLFRGIHETVGVDRSGGWRFGTTYGQDEILVYQIFNHAGDVPSMFNDLVYVDAPGVPDGTAILQLARYNDVYLDSQYENGADGAEFEYELIYTMTLSNPSDPESLKVAGEGPSVYGVPIRDMGDDKEDYRQNFLIENNRAEDDYSGLIETAQAWSLSGSDFHEAINEVLDVDQWLRAYAAMTLIGAADNYITGAQHNVTLYTPPGDGKTLLFPWDLDFAFMPSMEYAPLSSNADLDKLISLPANARLFYGHLYDIIQTTYNTTYMSYWVSHYDSLLPTQDLSSILSFIGARSGYVLTQLPGAVTFEITTNGGDPFTTYDPTVVIEGNGWIDVREIWLAGAVQPLAVTWNDQDSWQVTVPLASGENAITLEAHDHQGNLIASDSISVTSTNPSAQDFLCISELNYHPHDPTASELAIDPSLDAEQFEFVELLNTSDHALDLTGIRFSDGVDFTFAGGTLDAGQRIIVVRDAEAFAIRYGTAGITIAGEFENETGLKNSGETIELVDAGGKLIVRFTYSDSGDWPTPPDGDGASLVLVDPEADPSDAANWKSSIRVGGTPCAAPETPTVIINEVLSNTDEPLCDTIELVNTTDSPIDIAGWYLSDSAGNQLKYMIPLDTPPLAPGGYITFDESDFNAGAQTDFALNGDHGDDVWVVQVDANGDPLRILDHVAFGAAAEGVSLGRWPDADPNGALYPMQSRTLGGENAGPYIGDVVISEIQYNPGAMPGADALEYLELTNLSDATVSLNGWRISGGMSYTFASTDQIAAGGAIIVVGFDPADPAAVSAFETHYGLSGGIVLAGPYSDTLDDGGATIRLQRAGDPPPDEPTYTPWLLEDEVLYNDAPPWPIEADGAGDSLQRLASVYWARDAANWYAAMPTPGLSTMYVPIPGDADADGQVGESDAVILADNWGNQNATWTRGDFNRDGKVGAADAAILAANWGSTAQPPAEEVAVPATFVGPLPASKSPGARRLIEPPQRDESTMVSPSDSAAIPSDAATAASDAAVAEEYGPQADPATWRRQCFAWEPLVARRRSGQTRNDALEETALAVDQFHMMEEK